jgi:hypothetical protein
MSNQQEDSHDIYLRAPTSARPNPPLRLHANVAGKLIVINRDLDPKLADKIRSLKQTAEEHRSDGRTVLIDPPKALPPAPKKRKESSNMFRKPLKPTSTATKSIPSEASTSPAPISKEMRRRILHLVAIDAPTTDRVLSAVARNSPPHIHQGILACLRRVSCLLEVRDPC